MSMVTAARCTVLALAIQGLAAVAAPTQHKLNVSLAAQGQQTNISWSSHDSTGKTACGSACNYWQISAALIDPSQPWTTQPAVWPGASTTASANPKAVNKSVPAPTDETTSSGKIVIYDAPLLRKAAVAFTSTDKSVIAQVQKTGTAESRMAYHVRARNGAASTRDFFVRFPAPAHKNSYQYAYEVGGPSGDQPMPIDSGALRSRSSVDVLVDGLPVWFTAHTIHVPKELSASKSILQEFGAAAKDDAYVLYLGRFAPNARFTLDYIMRADAHSTADKCGNDSEPYPSNKVRRHCPNVAGGRSIPTGSVSGYRFEIYSTPVLPVTRVLQEIL